MTVNMWIVDSTFSLYGNYILIQNVISEYVCVCVLSLDKV